MLSSYLEKIKRLATERKTDLYVALLIILISIISFGLGRLSAIWPRKTPITVEQISKQGSLEKNYATETSSSQKFHLQSGRGQDGTFKNRYVASKNGKSYHYPWCSGAQLIKEENRVWFDTKAAAEKAGYSPAGNCQGL